MKKLILTLCIIAAASPALAIQRYNIETMTCSSVQSAVNRDGAAILRWQSKRNPGLPLYDRYVRNFLFCDTQEFTTRDYLPTADNASCPVLKCTDQRDRPSFNRD